MPPPAPLRAPPLRAPPLKPIAAFHHTPLSTDFGGIGGGGTAPVLSPRGDETGPDDPACHAPSGRFAPVLQSARGGGGRGDGGAAGADASGFVFGVAAAVAGALGAAAAAAGEGARPRRRSYRRVRWADDVTPPPVLADKAPAGAAPPPSALVRVRFFGRDDEPAASAAPLEPAGGRLADVAGGHEVAVAARVAAAAATVATGAVDGAASGAFRAAADAEHRGERERQQALRRRAEAARAALRLRLRAMWPREADAAAWTPVAWGTVDFPAAFGAPGVAGGAAPLGRGAESREAPHQAARVARVAGVPPDAALAAGLEPTPLASGAVQLEPGPGMEALDEAALDAALRATTATAARASGGAGGQSGGGGGRGGGRPDLAALEALLGSVGGGALGPGAVPAAQSRYAPAAPAAAPVQLDIASLDALLGQTGRALPRPGGVASTAAAISSRWGDATPGVAAAPAHPPPPPPRPTPDADRASAGPSGPGGSTAGRGLRRPCQYFNTPQGCRRPAEQCWYPHVRCPRAEEEARRRYAGTAEAWRLSTGPPPPPGSRLGQGSRGGGGRRG